MLTFAADSDNGVVRVTLYLDGAAVAEDTTYPYDFTLTDISAGNHTLKAIAEDRLGATTTSATVSFTVNAPPTVAITSPANNASFTYPAAFTVTATAADADGTIQKVEFRTTAGELLGTSTAAPYQVMVANKPIGTYYIIARAYDNDNVATTSSWVQVNIVGNQAPVVSITSPANGDIFQTYTSFNIVAAASDIDGTVARVRLYTDGYFRQELTTAPYVFSWSLYGCRQPTRCGWKRPMIMAQPVRRR